MIDMTFKMPLPPGIRLFEALVLGGLFISAFRWPAACGYGFLEVMAALLFPALLLDAVFQGRRAGWIFLACMIAFAGLFHWVPSTLEIQAPMPYPMAFTATVLLAAYESLGLLCVAFLCKTALKHSGALAAGCSAAFGIMAWELLALHIYPWHWGSALGGLPWMARSAAFMGAPGLSAWIWGCTTYVAALRYGHPFKNPCRFAPRLSKQTNNDFQGVDDQSYPWKQALAGIVACLGLPLLLSAAWFLLPRGPLRHLDVVIIQPNFVPGKWQEGMEKEMWQRTDALLAEKKLPQKNQSALVVWPESAVMERNDLESGNGIGQAAAKRQVAWIFGTDGRHGMHWYNLVRGEVEGRPPFIQAKVEPMPFGERMPGPAPLRRFLDKQLSFNSQSCGQLTPSSSFTIPAIGGELRIHPLICSEALDPLRVSKGLHIAGGDILSNHTNDGWFGKSIATDLHAAQLRLRAVEAGRPLLRATLTGKSGIFLADGHWQLWGEPMSEGAYHVNLQWQNRRTPASSPFIYWTTLGLLGSWLLYLFFMGKPQK